MVLVSRPHATGYDGNGCGEAPTGRPGPGSTSSGCEAASSRFGTGVCVVTVAGDGRRRTASPSTPSRPSRSTRRSCSSRSASRRGGTGCSRGAPFAVNVLGAEQEAVARHFSGDPHPDARALGGRASLAPTARGSARDLRVPSLARRTTAATTRSSSARSSSFDYRGGDALGYFSAASRRSRSPSLGRRVHLLAGRSARWERERARSTSRRWTSARSRSRSRGSSTPAASREIPQLRNVVRTYAELFDLQHDPALRDVMTYESPTTGDRVGMSFLQPQSVDDVVRRREAMRVWAEHSLGHLGRTGDYCSSAVMAMAARRRLVRPGRPRVRRERPPLLRARARERPAPDAHAGLPAGEPLRRPVAAAPRRRSPRASSTRTTTAS